MQSLEFSFADFFITCDPTLEKIHQTCYGNYFKKFSITFEKFKKSAYVVKHLESFLMWKKCFPYKLVKSILNQLSGDSVNKKRPCKANEKNSREFNNSKISDKFWQDFWYSI